MSVIPLTVCFSLGLVFLFVALFWREQRKGGRSPERDSLLPLADETPRQAGGFPAHAAPATRAGVPYARPESPAAALDADHSDPDACGCRDGARPPCAGCQRRPAELPLG